MADLLFLSQRLPYPPAKGEKIRAYHELAYLTRHYDVHLGCLTDDPADIGHAAALKPLCRDIHVAPLDPRLARITCLSGLLTHEGLSVTYFRDRSLAAWVRRVMDVVRPAVTFVYSSNMAPYVLDLPRTGRLIADLVDVDSAKWQAMADADRGPMRLVYRREWRRIEALEERIVRDSRCFGPGLGRGGGFARAPCPGCVRPDQGGQQRGRSPLFRSGGVSRATAGRRRRSSSSPARWTTSPTPMPWPGSRPRSCR